MLGYKGLCVCVLNLAVQNFDQLNTNFLNLFVEIFWQILLPTVVMLLLIAVRTQVDTQIHPAQL